jgi:hypothetical protein
MSKVTFDPEGFMALSPTQRVDICRHMAGCAEELAKAASKPTHRSVYLVIAEAWRELALDFDPAWLASQKRN